MKDKQAQKAGANSQLVQIAGDFVQGVTLDQALEVADLTARKVAAQEFAKADELAMQRMEELNARIIRELDDLKQLAAFADPAFQVSLRRAQIGAACTDKAADYDMLAQLLTDRATRGEERKVRAGLDLAIGVVDQIDDEALVGLTVFQAVTQFRPIQGTVHVALQTLDRLYGQLLATDLPEDPEWLDHLDVLGAIRISQVGTLKRFEEYFPAFIPGLVAPGVEAGSEAERLGLEQLAEVRLDLSPIEHDLKAGYRRVPFGDLAILENALRVPSGRPPDQIEVGLRVAQETYGLGQQDAALTEPLMAKVSEFPSVSRVRDWWNGIPQGVQVTAVGRVLARANAKRCDSLGMLPALD